jgi:hypothetical protein
MLVMLVYRDERVAVRCSAMGIFIGREHAQREYKLGDPSLLVGYEALDLWRWEMDALLDLLLPVVGVWGVVYFSFLARPSADSL